MSADFVKRGVKAGMFPELRLRARSVVHHMRSCNGCDVCLRSKAAAKPHARGTQAKELHDVVHMDICDVGTEVADGYKYFLICVEGASKYVWVRLLRTKAQAIKAAQEVVLWLSNQTGGRLKAVHSDRGSEFMSNEFQGFCKGRGIKPPQHGSLLPAAKRTCGTL